MPDRKLTYAVEIDAQQAQAQARALRAIFEQELKAISAGVQAQTSRSLAPGGSADAIRPTQQMKRALEEIGRVDLTKPADALIAQLGEVDNALKRTRNEYERLGMLASARASSGGAARRAQQGDYVDDVRRQVGDQAANAIAHTGRALNIGQRGAEFKSDEEAYYLEAEKDYIQNGEQRTQKMRHNAEEKQQLAQLELEMYEAELQGVRIQKELATRRMSQIEQQASGLEFNASTAAIFEEADRVQQETQELAQQEAELLRSISSTNDRLGDMMQQQATRSARSAGDLVAGGGVATTSQAAITVSARSVENAEKLAAALHEAADATQRIEKSRMNTDIRGQELEIEREKLKMQHQAAQQTAANVELEKTLGAAQRGEIAKGLAAVRAAEQQKTAAARAESQERIIAARTEGAVVVEAARTARAAAVEEERRRTAEVRAQVRERTGAQTTGARAGLPFGMTGTSLAMGAAAAVGIYSADQVVRTGLDWGREGASQMRMAETFENLAQRAGQSANQLKTAIRSASGQTITDMDAMALAAQVMARKWSSNIDDLSGDLGVLVAASRKYSRMFTDEQGNFLSTQEIFARFVKFSAEGNKELVDQFGLSNAAIADSLGITVDGLAGATGATDRWRGMVKLLGEDLDRLGATNDTLADKIERDANRILEARQRIGQALAPATGAVYEFGADVAEGVVGSFGEAQQQRGRGVMAVEQLRSNYTGTDAYAQEQIERAERLRMAVLQVYEAQKAGAVGAKEYAAALRLMLDEIEQTSRISDVNAAQLAGLNTWYMSVAGSAQEAADGISEAGDASEDAAARMDALGEATEGMSGDLRALAMVAISAGADIDGLGDAVDGLQERMAAALAAPEIAKFAEFNAAVQGVSGALLGQAKRAVELVGPQKAGEILEQQLASFEEIQAGLKKRNIIGGAQLPLTMEEALLELSAPFTAIEEAEKARIEAEREWERAAERTANEMERAAEQMVEEFKSSLQQVPGLFGGSSVTEEQMRQAGAGVEQSFADDYLRRLRDEVINKTDWAGVDINDAAQRAGINGGLPPDIILSLFEQAWQDQSLFAGGKNTDLINQDAVRASLARQDASKSGRNALFALFGVGEGESTPALAVPTPSDAGAVVGQTGGQGQPADGAAMLEQLTAAMEAGLDTSTKDRLFAVGSGIIESIHAGFSAGIENLEWGSQIIDSIAAAVAGPVFDMLNVQFSQP